MRRYAQVIRLKPEFREDYIQYHRAVWPEILAVLQACHIGNYSIFLRDDTLFAYFEYHGTDYAGDMRRMAAEPVFQRWWQIMDPMQEPFADAPEGNRWTELLEVFHFAGENADNRTMQ